MTSEDSELIDYYPTDFDTDLNGKKQDWEAVVLIPFIDEKRLLKAMAPIYEKLSNDDKKRNIHGPMLFYEYDDKISEDLEAPYGLPLIGKIHCVAKAITLKDVN